MTVETDIKTLLNALVSSRVFPDVAPNATPRPYITYQQAGGHAVAFLGREVPSKKHGHFQVNVWSDTRVEASAISLQIESAFITAMTFQASAVGAATSHIDDDAALYGARQDFSIWSER